MDCGPPAFCSQPLPKPCPTSVRSRRSRPGDLGSAGAGPPTPGGVARTRPTGPVIHRGGPPCSETSAVAGHPTLRSGTAWNARIVEAEPSVSHGGWSGGCKPAFSIPMNHRDRCVRRTPAFRPPSAAQECSTWNVVAPLARHCSTWNTEGGRRARCSTWNSHSSHPRRPRELDTSPVRAAPPRKSPEPPSCERSRPPG